MEIMDNLRSYHRARETQGDMMTNCNMGSWMGSRNRKKIRQKKKKKERNWNKI
jgi:hypothetical protein